jgi:hypothetical protein
MTMESPSHTIENDHIEAALLPQARRIGLRVFVLGALLQTVAVYLFSVTLMTAGYYRRTRLGSEVLGGVAISHL